MTLKEKKKQLVAAALAGLLLVGAAAPAIALAPSVSAAPNESEAADVWNGRYDFSWYKESKTTYAITNSRQLAGLAALCNGQYKKGTSGYEYDQEGNAEPMTFAGKIFRLARSLDLNNREWTPIANLGDASSGGFAGSFEGDDHIVYNVKITNKEEAYQGLFGVTDSASVLDGIHLRNASITASSNSGTLAGKAGGTVSNCSSTGSVTVEGDQAGGLLGSSAGNVSDSYSTASVKGGGTLGGLIGESQQGDVASCYARGLINASNDGAGGLIGLSQGTKLNNCYSTSTLHGKGTVGGLIGTMKSSSGVENSYFAGNIVAESSVGGLAAVVEDSSNDISSSHSSGMIVGKESVGGIAGIVSTAGNTIEKCYSTGTVQGENYVGGVVGSTLSKLEGCSSRGTVTGKDYVGGVAGKLEGADLEACYSTARVSGNERVGGVVGTADEKSIITSCYGTGAVSGKNFIGGLAGASWNTIEKSHARGNVTATGEYAGGLAGYTEGDVKNCYAAGNVSGANWVGGLVGVAYTKLVSECSATGNVTMSDGEKTSVGGLVGGLFGNLEYSYAAGTVTGKDLINGAMGGVVGTVYGSMSNCMALNTSVQGGGNLLGRVAGEYGIHPKAGTTGKISDCYAFRGMTVNGKTVQDDDTDPKDSLQGKGMDKSGFTGSFWTLAGFGGKESAWKIPDRTEVGIPVLKNMKEDPVRSVPALESSVKLDSKQVSIMGLSKTYRFLVKGNQDAKRLTIHMENPSILSVELVEETDARGTKYEIFPKKEGSTYVKVTYEGDTTYLKVDVRDITGSITLDTSNYTMAPGDSYVIGAVIKDEVGKPLTGEEIDQMVESGQLVVRDSRTGSIVDLKRLSKGNYRVTGKDEGSTYIIYEINGTHASVKIDVREGEKARGSSVRNTSYFFKEQDK